MKAHQALKSDKLGLNPGCASPSWENNVVDLLDVSISCKVGTTKIPPTEVRCGEINERTQLKCIMRCLEHRKLPIYFSYYYSQIPCKNVVYFYYLGHKGNIPKDIFK